MIFVTVVHSETTRDDQTDLSDGGRDRVHFSSSSVNGVDVTFLPKWKLMTSTFVPFIDKSMRLNSQNHQLELRLTDSDPGPIHDNKEQMVFVFSPFLCFFLFVFF